MSSRFEREIEELLRHLDDQKTVGQEVRRRPDGPGWRARLKRIMARKWGFLTTEQLVATLVALVLLSYVSRFALPAIGRFVAAGFLVAFVGLVLYVVHHELRRKG